MLSVILPTYNEAQNIETILTHIAGVLHAVPHEILVVDDDSPDGTWRRVEAYSQHDRSVRLLRRSVKRGLSSAVIDGFLASSGDVLAVMDADGQHDSTLLLKLYDAVRGGADIAVGSRYVEGGGVGEWDGGRHTLSRIATFLAMRILKRPDAAKVRDPMSGFFAVRREVFLTAVPKLTPMGFKILLDLLLKIPPHTVVTEVPLRFGVRRAGRSKLGLRVQLEFLTYLYHVTVGRTVALPTVTFAGIVAGVVLSLLMQLWPLRLLYLDKSVRTKGVALLEKVAAQDGWLLSDVVITRALPLALRVTHVPHGHGDQSTDCYLIFGLPTQSAACFLH